MVGMIDTCVVLDALQSRQPFSKTAQKIIYASACDVFLGVISVKALTDIFYLLKKYTHDQVKTKSMTFDLLNGVHLCDSTVMDVNAAYLSKINDFEDALLDETSSRINADFIITRNIKHFANSKVKAILPEDFLKLLPEYCQ